MCNNPLIRFPLIALLFASMFFACASNTSSTGSSAVPRVLNAVAGDTATYRAAGFTFNMKFIPGGFTFPMDFYDFGILHVTVDTPYWIAETETTYNLWKTVYDWASCGKDRMVGSGSYTFANPGRQGGDDSEGCRPVGNKLHPVTTVSWRDAMIWCNALTEWYNGHSGAQLRCVYYADKDYTIPIRSVDAVDDYPCVTTPGSQDNPYVKPDADGFRLPTRDEWVLAARYRGEDPVNTEEGFQNPYYTKGLSASGAIATVRDAEATKAVAWYYDNSAGSTKVVGTAGKGGRKALTGKANALGLYDMSGNVMEFSFDWLKPQEMGENFRIGHGGSWADSAACLKMNIRMNIAPHVATSRIGFRFAKNASPYFYTDSRGTSVILK